MTPGIDGGSPAANGADRLVRTVLRTLFIRSTYARHRIREWYKAHESGGRKAPSPICLKRRFAIHAARLRPRLKSGWIPVAGVVCAGAAGRKQQGWKKETVHWRGRQLGSPASTLARISTSISASIAIRDASVARPSAAESARSLSDIATVFGCCFAPRFGMLSSGGSSSRRFA